jgi:hypothetical protein
VAECNHSTTAAPRVKATGSAPVMVYGTAPHKYLPIVACKLLERPRRRQPYHRPCPCLTASWRRQVAEARSAVCLRGQPKFLDYLNQPHDIRIELLQSLRRYPILGMHRPADWSGPRNPLWYDAGLGLPGVSLNALEIAANAVMTLSIWLAGVMDVASRLRHPLRRHEAPVRLRRAGIRQRSDRRLSSLRPPGRRPPSTLQPGCRGVAAAAPAFIWVTRYTHEACAAETPASCISSRRTSSTACASPHRPIAHPNRTVGPGSAAPLLVHVHTRRTS